MGSDEASNVIGAVRNAIGCGFDLRSGSLPISTRSLQSRAINQSSKTKIRPITEEIQAATIGSVR